MKQAFRNLVRHAKMSILSAVIGVLTVLLLVLYAGNIDSTRRQLAMLPEAVKIRGAVLPNELSGRQIAEVTPGFYETEEGRHWQALIRELEMGIWHSVPVTATENTGLIPVFYDGSAYVEQGREFTPEDYSEGRRVCLVNRRFARRNDLRVGDILHLPLRYADYSSASGQASWNGALTAQGEVLPVFEEGGWEICGIYDMLPGASTKSKDYQLDDNEIIIPKSSIRNDDGDNISAWGYREGWNTSFEISNGSIGHWKELWEEQGIDGLEITFYDKGYTILEDGIRRMKKMALILLAAALGITAVMTGGSLRREPLALLSGREE